MIKPLELEIECFRGWTEHVDLKLEFPITAIVADNGCGKSSTMNAIEWCLFGDVVCGKTSSKIDERSEWELRPRGGSSAPTRVRFSVETDRGRMEIVRTASMQSSRKVADELEVRIAGGPASTGARAEALLRTVGFPDWDTYRRAHCFHQEAARTRVLEGKDRSAILAVLLGLEDDLALRAAFEDQKPAKLIEALDAELGDLESFVTNVLGRPRKEMEAIETGLKTRGIERTRIPGETAAVRTRLIRGAEELAGKLGFTVVLPHAEDGPEVVKWARTWPQQARADAPALARIHELRQKQARLAEAISRADAAEGEWRRLAAALEAAVTQNGDLAARKARLEAARAGREQAHHAVAATNERAALFTQAQTVLASAAEPDRCPVCDARVSGLLQRLRDETRKMSTHELGALLEARSRADQVAVSMQRECDEIEGQMSDVQLSAERREQARTALVDLVGPTASDDRDVLADARKLSEGIAGELRTLEALAGERDTRLGEHDEDLSLLRELEKWADASRRAEREVDLEGIPAWETFNEAIDACAGLAGDLVALAEIARDAQAERSSERETAVNAALGKYYRLIIGDSAADIRLSTKRTGQKILYELFDQNGQPAVPVLNQASINALSLALLFAQAEDQASKNGFAGVVLDDPSQSLDAERQAGLVRAVEALSESCGVILGLIPGPTVERIRDFVSRRRTLVYLQPWSAVHGARVERMDSL